jgi:hypothetical protein
VPADAVDAFGKAFQMLKGRGVMWSEWWVWGVAAIVAGGGGGPVAVVRAAGLRHRGGAVALVLLVGGPLAVWLGGSLPVLFLVFAVVSLIVVAGAEEMAGCL